MREPPTSKHVRAFKRICPSRYKTLNLASVDRTVDRRIVVAQTGRGNNPSKIFVVQSKVDEQVCNHQRKNSNTSNVRVATDPHQDGDFVSVFTMVIHRPDASGSRRMALLDSGSAQSAICQQVVNELRLTVEPYLGPPLRPVGPLIHPRSQTTVDWHVDGKNRVYRTSFAVLDDHLCETFDVLLCKNEIRRLGFHVVNGEVL